MDLNHYPPLARPLRTEEIEEPRRITQTDLDEALETHLRFLQGIKGGQRLSLNFTDACRLDFQNRDLSHAQLVGAHLEGSVLTGAKLVSANLFAARLSGADLSDSDLSKADLRGAVLRRVNLENAILEDADIRGGFVLVDDGKGNLKPFNEGITILEEVNLAGADLTGARLNRLLGTGTDLTGAVFRNARIVNADLSKSNLRGAVFTGADLSGTDLSGCLMNGAVLSEAILDGANLEGADLTAAYLAEANLSYARTVDAKMPKSLDMLEQSIQDIVRNHMRWIASLGRDGRQANLSGVDLQNVDLTGFNLSAANLSSANLAHSLMTAGAFTMADFNGALALGRRPQRRRSARRELQPGEPVRRAAVQRPVRALPGRQIERPQDLFRSLGLRARRGRPAPRRPERCQPYRRETV